MTIILNSIGNPITREERIKINENWQRIMSGYTNLQMQINVLAGGEELEELIRRLNETVENANVAVQDAIKANYDATQEAIEENNVALQTALDTVSQTLVDMNKAISNANTATSEANAAKQGALDATVQAQTAINTMQSLIKNMGHQGTWSNTTQYYKNNMVEYNSSTFIAVQDNLGKQPPTLPTKNNAFWSLFAEQGAKGDKGDTGTGINVKGNLASTEDLPSSGEIGDSYLIQGNLYVWGGESWENAGNIQGPKGEPGKDADLTEINQKVDKLKTEVNEHLDGIKYAPKASYSATKSEPLIHETWGKVLWDVKFIDTSNFVDGTSPTRIKIPESGMYLVTANVNLPSGEGVRNMKIVKNSIEDIAYASNLGTYVNVRCSISTLHYFNTNEYFEVMLYQDSNKTVQIIPGGGLPNLSIAKLGDIP